MATRAPKKAAPAEEPQRPPLVRVIWEDATQMDDGAWVENKDHTYKPHIVDSVGYLLYEGEEGVILTQAWNAELVGARDQIPRGMIREIHRLKA